MPKRSFLDSFFVLSGTALIALTSGFVWIVGPGSIVEYLGLNRHLFGLIQASRGKALYIGNDSDDRALAVKGLYKSRAASVSYLISLLNSSDSAIRLDSLIVLGKVLGRGSCHSNSLSRDILVSEELLESNIDAAPQIIRLLNDPNQEVRLSAINTLGLVETGSSYTTCPMSTRQTKLDSDIVSSIVQLLYDPDQRVRLKAISMLGTMKAHSKFLLPTLTQLISDLDPSIRDTANNSTGCLEGADKKYCEPPSSNPRRRY